MDGFTVQLAASPTVLQTAVDLHQWTTDLRNGPWLLAVLSLLTIYGRWYFVDARNTYWHSVQHRLQHLLLAISCLLIVRLVSLWDPITYLFPYLTLLWSPHTSWSLSLALMLYPHLPAANDTVPRRAHMSVGRVAFLLFLFSSLLYGLYAFHFCRVTMLHGDEARYLQVTYSLLHDGDMDLANNLGAVHTDEFHTRPFAHNRAAASPPDKVYSVHPIGLSVLLVPAYWLGLEYWQNPRLACALFIAVLAAACIALAFLWLVRLGHKRPIALFSSLIMGLNAPFFFFTNQLYPEIPALLIVLTVLLALAHWQLPQGGYLPMSKEPHTIAFLVFLLGLLPFLHPRYLPLTALGIPIILQGRYSPQRRLCFIAIGIVSLAAASALLVFNLTFSNDWMGHFRPGNAWPAEGAIELETLLYSLPGQWFLADVGLANNAPIFLLAFWGWAFLAVERDRRLLVTCGLYLGTAVVNGLHGSDWTMGFSYPARFMVVALPALLLGLSRALDFLMPRLPGFLLTAGAFIIGLDSVWVSAVLPELGYRGRALADRAINSFYPLGSHFSANQDIILAALVFWLLLLALVFFAFYRRSLTRVALLSIAALLPFLWSHSQATDGTLGASLSPYMQRLPRNGDDFQAPKPTYFALSQPVRSTTGARMQDNRYLATHPTHAAGVLISYHMPIMRPGLYTLLLPDLRVNGGEQTAGHIVITQRKTLPASSDGELRLSRPLHHWDANKTWSFPFHSQEIGLGHLLVEFSGFGEISLRHRRLAFIPWRTQISRIPLHDFDIKDTSTDGEGIRFGQSYLGLEQGRYQADFTFSGSALSSFTQRHPPPIVAAIYTGAAASEQDRAKLKRQVDHWFSQERSISPTVERADFLRPQVERVYPPWRILPFTDNTCELIFTTEQKEDVWFLVQYNGDLEIRLEGITLHRLKYEKQP